MALPEGTRVYVAYDLGGPPLFHERYVLAACACGQGYHVILTPDFEMYAEQISLENTDLESYRIGHGADLPAGLGANNTYRFRNMPDAGMMAQYRRDALQAAAAMAVAPGGVAAAPMGMVPAPAAAPAAAVVADEVWVRIETKGEKLRGEEITLDGSEVLHGDVGLKTVNQESFAIRKVKRAELEKYKGIEASADARLLSLQFQEVSRAERQWRDVSRDIHEEKFDDWNVPGPRTAEWCVRFLNRRNGGPVDHHRWWMQNHGLKSDSWGVSEHDTLMKMIDKLGRFDGLDLSNLAGAEVAFRRLQLIEFMYSERGPGGGKGSSKSDKKDAMTSLQQHEASIFAGAHKEFGDVMVCPALLDFVAKEVEGEAAVLKQVRKAREERAAASK